MDEIVGEFIVGRHEELDRLDLDLLDLEEMLDETGPLSEAAARLNAAVDVAAIAEDGFVLCDQPDVRPEQGKAELVLPIVTVRCGGNRYAIPQASVQELVRLDGSDHSPSIEGLHGTPVYRLRENLVPIVDLRRQLGVERADEATVVNIVVLHVEAKSFGLVVDQIEDTEEIVVKPLGCGVKEIAMFAGATIMGDGTVALILDVMVLGAAAPIADEIGAPS